MAVPTVAPETTPPVVTEATPGEPLLHVPPPAASLSVIGVPMQTLDAPVIDPAFGKGLTVNGIAATQLPIAYFIVSVPPDKPVTAPVVPTVAIPVLVLLHTPPVGPSARVTTEPTQTLGVPVIVPGDVATVTVAVAVPAGAVYVIIEVPGVTPVTTPADVIVATPGVPLVHVPPADVSASVVVDPAQTVVVPVIAPTVTVTGISSVMVILPRFHLSPPEPPV